LREIEAFCRHGRKRLVNTQPKSTAGRKLASKGHFSSQAGEGKIRVGVKDDEDGAEVTGL